MNTIKIKHGSGVPDGKLQPYELGFCDDDGMLYIGTPSEEGLAYPLMYNYLSKYGGIIEGDLEINGYLTLNPKENDGLYIYQEYENGSSGIFINSYTMELYANFQDGVTNWERGMNFHFNDYLGSIAMAGFFDQVECVYVGKNTEEAWLKIIPEVGIQTDSIILKPYNTDTGKGSFGYENPNDANIPGIPGQLYFVVTG